MENPGEPEALAAEVEALRAERDALAEEAARLDRRVHGGRLRHLLVGVLVVLTCLSFLTASLGFWAHRNILNTDVWIERVGPLASDPAVQTALAAQITDQAMTLIDPQALFESVLPEKGKLLAVPLAGAVRKFVNDKALQFVKSDTFAKLWVHANRVAHENAVATLRGESPSPSVSTAGGRIILNLIPALDALLLRISQLSPEIFGRAVDIPKLTTADLPDVARAKLAEALGVDIDEDFGVITVYEGDALSTSQTVMKLFDRVFVGSIPVTILLIAATIAVSRRRRRTILQLLVGFALMLVLIRRIALRSVNDVIDLIRLPMNKAAVTSILHAFADPLLHTTSLILTGFAVAIVVLLLTGPYRWAVAIRRGTVDAARGTAHFAKGTVSAAGAAATSDPTTAWLVAHATELQWAGGIAFVAALWWMDLSWLGLLLVAAVIGAFELWVSRLVPPSESDGTDDGGDGAGSGDEPSSTPTIA